MSSARLPKPRPPQAESSLFKQIHFFTYRDRPLAFLPATTQLMQLTRRAWTTLFSSTPSAEHSRSKPLEELRLLASALPTTEWPPTLPDALLQSLLRHSPRKMSIFLSRACNFRCEYCYEFGAEPSPSEGHMANDTIRHSIDYLMRRSSTRKFVTLTLFGGEPLLNWDGLCVAVDYASHCARRASKKVCFSLTTNGSLLTDSRIAFLRKHEFALLLSLDGPPKLHDRYRRLPDGAGTFTAVAPQAKRLIELMPNDNPPRVRATMARGNANVAALADFFCEFGFRSIGIGTHEGRAAEPDTLVLEPSERAELASQFDTLAGSYVEHAKEGRLPDYDPFTRGLRMLNRAWNHTGVSFAPCGLCRNDLSVDVDGSLYPCHRFCGLAGFPRWQPRNWPRHQGRGANLQKALRNSLRNLRCVLGQSALRWRVPLAHRSG
jgi:uncharacterized protein